MKSVQQKCKKERERGAEMKKLARWTLLLAFTLLVATGVNAQSNPNETALFDVTDPIDVGGTILQSGTYRIKVVPLSTNRNLLRVTSEDESKLYVSVIAVPHAPKAAQASPEDMFVYFPSPTP